MTWTANLTPASRANNNEDPPEAMNANTRQTNIPGIDIPTHDYVATTYHGSTNNLATVVYRIGGASGAVVATLTLAYVGGVPVADDARLSTVVKS